MSKKTIFRRILQILLIGMCVIGVIGLFQKEEKEPSSSLLSQMEIFLWDSVREQMVTLYMPIFLYGQTKAVANDSALTCFASNVPLFSYCMKEADMVQQVESASTIEIILQQEARDEETPEEERPDLEVPESTEGILYVGNDMLKELEKENQLDNGEVVEREAGVSSEESENVQEEETVITSGFPLNKDPVQEYQWDYYKDFDNLIHDFYAVDASTKAKPEQINVEAFREKDMKLTTSNENPQILIYHTHSQEDFVDSVPGDSSTTIMGAGERLAEILREEYGFHVIHHEGTYDVESRDYAYSNALPEIEKVIEENPSVEVVIDLHRDAMPEHTKLVTDINGKPTARFMFFNGLSYLNQTGPIAELENPYIDTQLAFSFQMQVLANEYYPGLTRKIYLKGYRYNMHICPKTLLIELGAQTNTREEIWNALEPLAHILAMELGYT